MAMRWNSFLHAPTLSYAIAAVACLNACKADKPDKAAAQPDPWAAGAAASAAPKADSSAGAKKWYDAEAPVGVWIGLDVRLAPTPMSDGTVSYLSSNLQLATFVVWPDGSLSRDAPWAGLADFDHAAWERDVATDPSLGGTPGTYKRDSDGWHVTYKGGHEAQLKLVGDELRIEKAKLQRATDVTGATLDGAYTYFSDPEDPSLAQAGCQRLVTFTRDGHFDNRGGFARTCPAAPNDPGAPGAGTYEIRDFSLVLHYADGRTAKHLLTAPQSGDLRTDNSRALIMGQVWQRRTGAIANAAPPSVPSTPSAPPPAATTGDTITYDVVAFGTPPGQPQRYKTSMSFTATDGDAFCMTVVFAGMPSTGKPKRDFAEEWKEALLNGRTADVTPEPQEGQTPSGLMFNAGGSMTTEIAGGARVFRAFFVFEVGSRRVSVMFVAPTEAQLAGCHLEDFLRTIRPG
jgi:hypothetical protein